MTAPAPVTAANIEQAKREAHQARARLDSTLAALQARLDPATLASDAWTGVRDKSNDLADGALDAVKQRPAVAAGVVAATLAFLARRPLYRLARWTFTKKPADEGVVTTTIPTDAANYSPAAPLVEVPPSQGVLT